jgi:hypothetical protein
VIHHSKIQDGRGRNTSEHYKASVDLRGWHNNRACLLPHAVGALCYQDDKFASIVWHTQPVSRVYRICIRCKLQLAKDEVSSNQNELMPMLRC